MSDSSDDERPLIADRSSTGGIHHARVQAGSLRVVDRPPNSHPPRALKLNSSNKPNQNQAGKGSSKRTLESGGKENRNAKRPNTDGLGKKGNKASSKLQDRLGVAAGSADKRSAHENAHVRSDNEFEEGDDNGENWDSDIHEDDRDACRPKQAALNDTGGPEGDERPKRNQIVIREMLPTAYIGLNSFPQSPAASTIKLFLQPSAIFNRKHACSKDFVDWRGVTRGVVMSKFIHTGKAVERVNDPHHLDVLCKWASPWGNGFLRPLEGDICFDGPLRIKRDHAGLVMCAIQATSPPTNVPNLYFSDVCLPRGDIDPGFLNMMCNGPDGGSEGGVSSILWNISKADEVNPGSVNPNMLKFLYLFSMTLNNDEAPHMYYGRQTSRLDINLTKTSRAVKICGVRYQNPMNARAVRAQSLLGSEEVLDATLLRKLVSFAKSDCSGVDMEEVLVDMEGEEEGFPYVPLNCEDDLQMWEPSSVIHSTQQLNDPNEKGKRMSFDNSLEENCISCCPPVKLIYSTLIVPGVSRDGHSEQLYVEVIRMQSPNGIEPLEALRQASQRNGELCSVLLKIVHHMCQTMQWKHIDSIDKLFALGSDVGAYDLMNEGNILYATMMKAFSYDIQNVHFNGQRLDVQNCTEVADWNEEQQVIIDERKQYASKIVLFVNAALNLGPRGIDRAQAAVDTEFPEGIYTGTHMRRLDRKQLDIVLNSKKNDMLRDEWCTYKEANSGEMMDVDGKWDPDRMQALFEKFEEETSAGTEFDQSVNEMFSIHNVTCGSVKYYDTPEDRENLTCTYNFPFNGSINWNGANSFHWEFLGGNVKELTDKKEMPVIESPFITCPLAMAYLNSILANDKSYSKFWTNREVPTVKYIMDEHKSMSQSILTLRMLVAEARERQIQQTSKDVSLDILLGIKRSNNIRDLMKQIQMKSSLASIVEQTECLSNAIYEKQMSRLLASDVLKHQIMVARGIRDLKSQGENDACMWINNAKQVVEALTYNSNFKNIHQGLSLGHLNETNAMYMMWLISTKKLELDLCHWNTNILQMLLLSMSSIFSFNDQFPAGYCIMISDLGLQGFIRSKTQFNNGFEDNVLQRKSPGAGADLIMLAFTRIIFAYLQNIPASTSTREYFTEKETMPKNLNAVSRVSIQSLAGSAGWVDSHGQFTSEARAQLMNLGKIGFMSDMFKTKGQDKGIMKVIEQAVDTVMKEATGPQTQAWMTYEGGVKKEMRRILPGIPLLMVCSNSGDPELPSSAIIRIAMVHAGVQDGMRGVVCVEEKGAVAKSIGNQAQEGYNSDEDMDIESNVITDSRNFIDPEKEDVQLRDISKASCQESPLYFIGNSMMHCVVKQILAGIDLYLHCQFSLRADVLSVITNISTLSSGLLRGVVGGKLNFNRDELLRVLKYGRFMKTDVPGEHMWFIFSRAFFIRSQIVHTGRNGDEVNISAAVNDFVYSMLDVPVNIQTILTALYLNLTSNLLNVNIMIASTFLLFVSRCTNHCPLHVLALASCGEDLSEQQTKMLKNSFDYFDMVCDLDSRKPVNFPCLLKVHQLQQEITPELVIDLFFEFDNQEKRDAIVKWHDDNLPRSPTKMLKSWYVKALEHDFDAIPVILQQRDVKKGNNASMSSKFNSMTELGWWLLVETIKDDATKSRLKAEKKLSTLTRNASLPVLNVKEFWSAMHDGTRFPQQMQFSTDTQHRDHISTQETPVFWKNFNVDMSTIGSFVQHVLQFFKLPMNASRRDLFEAVFRSFESRSPGRNTKTNKTFPCGPGPWSDSIMSTMKENYECVFVHVAPIINEQKQTNNMKVSRPAGVKVVICVDILWLLLSQALFTAEWYKKTVSKRMCTLHLRNLSHAAQSILTMFIHLQIELSIIPALHNRQFLLRNMNPNQQISSELASLPFFMRLHKDFLLTRTKTSSIEIDKFISPNTHLSAPITLGSSDTFKMVYTDAEIFINLSTTARNTRFFTWVSCKDKTGALAYKRDIQKANSVEIIQTKFDLSPFVPESIAHMHCFYKHILVFSKRFHRENADMVVHMPYIQNFVGLAVQIGTLSWSVNFTVHLPLSLTQSMVDSPSSSKIEIPIVTMGRVNGVAMNFLGVLVRRGNRFTLRGVEPTSVLLTEAAIKLYVENETGPWQAIPFLVDEELKWESSDISLAQSHGLWFDGENMHMRHPRRVLQGSIDLVPFTFMPKYDHQAMLLVRVSRQQYRVWDEAVQNYSKVTEFDVRELFESQCISMLSTEKSLDWLKSAYDIPALANREDEFRVVCDTQKKPMCFWILQRYEGKTFYFHFNSREHLKYTLQANNGLPMNKGKWNGWKKKQFVYKYMGEDHRGVYGFHMMWQNITSNGASRPFIVLETYEDACRNVALDAYRHAINTNANPTVIQEKISALGMTQCTATKVSTLLHITEVDPTLTVCIPDHGTEKFDEKTVLAVLIHHEQTPHFMLNGCYALSLRYDEKYFAAQMDFMSFTHCVLREGQRLYLSFTNALYNQLVRLKDGITVHDSVLDKISSGESIQLECYYANGNACREYYSGMEHLKIDLVILVHCDVHGEDNLYVYDERRRESKLFYETAVFDSDGVPLVSFTRECDTCIGNLNYRVN